MSPPPIPSITPVHLSPQGEAPPVRAWVAVASGGALGGLLRWFLSQWNGLWPGLPVGTLAANLGGGFFIGVALQLFNERPSLSPTLRLFAVTGILGGLTTFSTFSREAVDGLLGPHPGAAGILILAHVLGSLIMTLLGMALVRFFLRGRP